MRVFVSVIIRKPTQLGGWVIGAAFRQSVRQARGSFERVRTDLSSTLFFSDPEEYDGGELEIQHPADHIAQRPANR